MTRLLTDRPNDAVDIFEDISKLEKKEKFVNKVDTLIDKPDKSTETKLAETQRSLFVVRINLNIYFFSGHTISTKKFYRNIFE